MDVISFEDGEAFCLLKFYVLFPRVFASIKRADLMYVCHQTQDFLLVYRSFFSSEFRFLQIVMVLSSTFQFLIFRSELRNGYHYNKEVAKKKRKDKLGFIECFGTFVFSFGTVQFSKFLF